VFFCVVLLCDGKLIPVEKSNTYEDFSQVQKFSIVELIRGTQCNYCNGQRGHTLWDWQMLCAPSPAKYRLWISAEWAVRHDKKEKCFHTSRRN